MTGFARMEGVSGEWRWAWEARSVNGKGLEARFRLPTGFDRLDIKARDLAKARFSRGNIQASLNLRRESSAGSVSEPTSSSPSMNITTLTGRSSPKTRTAPRWAAMPALSSAAPRA